jgi:Glycosidases
MNWVALLVLLSTASSVLSSVRCNQKEWWKNTVIYQILVPSFKDSNNDGIGDLRGKNVRKRYLELTLGLGTNRYLLGGTFGFAIDGIFGFAIGTNRYLIPKS